MSVWTDAAALIADAFADPEPLIYTQGGAVIPAFSAIRSDRPAPNYGGPGQSERIVSYEISFNCLPRRPRAGENFVHRGRRWKVGDVADLDEVSAWEVIVTDGGRV